MTSYTNKPQCPPENVLSEIQRRYHLDDLGRLVASVDYGGSALMLVKAGTLVRAKKGPKRKKLTLTCEGVQYSLQLAHVVWFVGQGEWPEIEIDFINGDHQDCSLGNLRLVDRSQNMRAYRHVEGGRYSSDYRGVHRLRNRWKARLMCRDADFMLGNFRNEHAAALAWNLAAALHGYAPEAMNTIPSKHLSDAIKGVLDKARKCQPTFKAYPIYHDWLDALSSPADVKLKGSIWV